jgi:hypothetical protein
LGDFYFESDRIGILEEGDWIPDQDDLYLKNISIEYRGYPGKHPKNNTIRVYFDNGKINEGRWDYIQGETGEIKVETYADEDERIGFSVIITDTANDEIQREVFYFFVDGTPPPGIRNLRVHADSYNDNNYYDNDHEVFVTWTLVDDTGPGLMEYRYCLDEYSFHDYNVTHGFFSMNISGVGQHTIWLWGVDNIGIPGSSDRFDFWIDTEPVKFHYPDIEPGMPLNVSENSYDLTIRITDDVSGVNKGTMEYRQTVAKGAFSDWKTFNYPSWSYHDILITMNIQLDLNYTNQIQFRAEDLSSNGIVESGIFLIDVVLVDPVTLEQGGPLNGSYLYESALLKWSMIPSMSGSESYKVHLISPDGSNLIYETINRYYEVDIAMAGEWKWFVEAEMGGHSFFSEERTIIAVSSDMGISIPISMSITRGDGLVIPISINNELQIPLMINIRLTDSSFDVINGTGNHYIDPEETNTTHITFDTNDLEIGEYTLQFKITDDLGRSLTHDFVLKIEPGKDVIDDPDEENDILFWELVILIGIVTLVAIVSLIIYVRSKISRGNNPEE